MKEMNNEMELNMDELEHVNGGGIGESVCIFYYGLGICCLFDYLTS